MTIENQNEKSFSLLEQGIAWIKLHQDEIAARYAEIYATIPTSFYQNMSQEELLQAGQATVSGIVQRLEGKTIDSSRMTKIYEKFLDEGGKLQDLQGHNDMMVQIFIQKLERDRSINPEVRQVLIQKLNYLSNLVKSSMAAAIVSKHTQKKA